MAFTFKKEPREGKWGWLQKKNIYIKLNQKKVGDIFEETHGGVWGITFFIKKEPIKEKPADFKHVTLVKRFETSEDAKIFLNEKFNTIINEFDLYQFED